MVLINISSASIDCRGLGKFTNNIVSELLDSNKHNFVFVSANKIDNELHKKIIKKGCKLIMVNSPLPIFEQIIIPYLVYKIKPDICWFPSNTFPVLQFKNSIYIVTIHDLIFLNKGLKGLRLYQIIGKFYRKIIFCYGVNKVDVVTSVSQTSISRISRISDNKRLKKDIILYNSIDTGDSISSGVLDRYKLKGKKFIYTISGTSPHKNLDFLIKSFLKLSVIDPSFILVVSGAYASKFNGLYDNILFTTFIKEDEKKCLIKESSFFVFASLVEGFGIPLIEGLYLNGKVLVSDIEIFRELGRDYVSYFDPYDENFLVKYCGDSNLSVNHKEVQKYILDNFSRKETSCKLVGIFDEFKQ